MAQIEWKTQIEIDEERESQAWASLRAYRNKLLAESDWTQLSDVPIQENERNAWRAYRQALRDITEQPGAPWDIEWPDPPGEGGQ